LYGIEEKNGGNGLDDIAISVIFTFLFVLVWFGFRKLSGEQVNLFKLGDYNPLSGRYLGKSIFFIIAVLITSNAYHVLYGENTISNYFEDSTEGRTWLSAFDSDIQCQTGHSAQLDPSKEALTVCEDSFLDSHWLDTYEFTVASTFFVAAFAIALLFMLPDILSYQQSGNSFRENLLAGFVITFPLTFIGFLYGFVFSSFPRIFDLGEGPTNIMKTYMFADGAILVTLLIYGVALAVPVAGEED
jgi:hypothetical protein